MPVQIKIRIDTTERWYDENPILAKGEMAIEQISDKKAKIKIGNGIDNYSKLEYFADKILYDDVINKPLINNIELKGNLTLTDLGIQPIGSYVLQEDVAKQLALKADADKTYTITEIDTFFNNLIKVPDLGGHNGQYLKSVEGEVIWSDITGDIVSTKTFKTEMDKKVDKVEGSSLINDNEIKRLALVDNYDDTKIVNDINGLKAEIDNKASINQLDNYLDKDALDVKLGSYALKTDIVEKANASELNAHITNKLNPHNVTKAQVGLSNVDNTSDLEKPISISVKRELDSKQHCLTVGYGLDLSNNHLTNTLPHVQADWNSDYGSSAILNRPDLKLVATSGSYNDLADKPIIPNEYSLPNASETELGGIKVGYGLTIDEAGILSAPNKILDYTDIDNKPSIGGVELLPGQTADDLDLASGKATQSALNLKADKDLMNVNEDYDFIIKRGVNEDGSWYRLYKSGWLEQGGKLLFQGIGSTMTYNLPNAYKDSNYCVYITSVESGTNTMYVKNVLKQSFDCYMNGENKGLPIYFYWKTEGQK